MVLLLTYRRKCTALYCCVQPTKAAPGEKYSSSIVVVRVGGSVVGVPKKSFFIHESHPGVVLLMYHQKCTATAYCCVQPTRAAAGERCMCAQQIQQQQYSISTRRAECCTGVVHKISFFVHESHPGVVLLLMYQQKCTAVCCCVQPTRPAAGERRWASKQVIHTGSGISYVQRRAKRSINTHSNRVRYSINGTWYNCCV